MKKHLIVIAVLALTTQACQKDIYLEPIAQVQGQIPVNPDHPMKDSLTAIVNKHIGKGVPGLQVMVKNNDGWYVVNGGYAGIEQQQPMQDRMIAWLYSITKIYTATMVMQLKDQGLINLDASIQEYLPQEITRHLSQSEQITTRMLLNHSSGLRNFTIMPAYQMAQFNAPLEQPDLMEQLALVYDKPLLFEPGTDFFYSNTNYLLLQLMLEKISAKSYAQLLQEKIIAPLGLTQTIFDASDEQIKTLGFPNYYFERYNNGQLENVTKWHNAIAQSLEGYGGVCANGADVIRFMEALINGQLVSPQSLQEMRTWIQASQSTEPDYGLGLEYYEYIKGTPTYGHEGDDIGGTTQILYVPSNQTYIFITENAGRQIFGQYLFRTSEAKIELCRYVSREQ